jgi:heme-degrading monooxygenase HmoA
MSIQQEKSTADIAAVTEAEDAAFALLQDGLVPDKEATFVALSKFLIANGMMEEVKEAFRNRPHLVDNAPGFVRMEVMRPFDSPEEVWLITYWTDEQSYRVWHRSHLYHESHKGIPKGLKVVPGSAQIRLFEFICS